MTNIRASKQFHFDAAHFLKGHSKCGQTHGHTYVVEVEVMGEVNFSGMVTDFAEIKRHVDPLISILDHRCLNNLGQIDGDPTAENVCLWLVRILQKQYGAMLTRVKIWENPLFGSQAAAEWRIEDQT